MNAKDISRDLMKGQRIALSKAITLVESTLENHQELAQEILKECISVTGNSLRIAITGVPGVGKSTFIEALGLHLTAKGIKVAVLAVDPSSELSGGSILGDKTRMQGLSSNKLAFIRPTPSSGSLGGVAKKTRETILLCEAAGYEIILIETVGVGQSETAVHSMVDFFLLLMLAGAGDELQGIKRGIMEMVDGIVINKADGDNIINAKKAQSQYQSALHLFPPTDSAWTPKVLYCSSLEKTNIDIVWNMIDNFQNHMQKRGLIVQKRKNQNQNWLHEMIKETLNQRFYKDHQEQIHKLEKEVLNTKITPSQALKKLLP